jgi:predicted permease
LPYCRICGTKIEENAHFCHRCGTPVATFTAASQAKPMKKSSMLIPVIILIAVLVVAVIVGALVFWAFYSSFNRANGSNQSNGSELSFNFLGYIAKINGITQNFLGKTSLINTSAKELQHTNPQSCSTYKLRVTF